MTRRAMIVAAASLFLAVAGSGYALPSHETGEVKAYTGSPTQAAEADAAFATTHWAENAFPVYDTSCVETQTCPFETPLSRTLPEGEYIVIGTASMHMHGADGDWECHLRLNKIDLDVASGRLIDDDGGAANATLMTDFSVGREGGTAEISCWTVKDDPDAFSGNASSANLAAIRVHWLPR
jgi:hypothetical protein